VHAERWERVQAMFHAALERPEAERRAFVERRFAGAAHRPAACADRCTSAPPGQEQL